MFDKVKQKFCSSTKYAKDFCYTAAVLKIADASNLQVLRKVRVFYCFLSLLAVPPDELEWKML